MTREQFIIEAIRYPGNEFNREGVNGVMGTYRVDIRDQSLFFQTGSKGIAGWIWDDVYEIPGGNYFPKAPEKPTFEEKWVKNAVDRANEIGGAISNGHKQVLEREAKLLVEYVSSEIDKLEKRIKDLEIGKVDKNFADKLEQILKSEPTLKGKRRLWLRKNRKQTQKSCGY